MSRVATDFSSLVAQINKRKAPSCRRHCLAIAKEKTNLGQMCDLTSFTSHTSLHTHTVVHPHQAKVFQLFCFMWQRVKVELAERNKASGNQREKKENTKLAALSVSKCCIQYNFARQLLCSCCCCRWPDKSSKCECCCLAGSV